MSLEKNDPIFQNFASQLIADAKKEKKAGPKLKKKATKKRVIKKKATKKRVIKKKAAPRLKRKAGPRLPRRKASKRPKTGTGNLKFISVRHDPASHRIKHVDISVRANTLGNKRTKRGSYIMLSEHDRWAAKSLRVSHADPRTKRAPNKQSLHFKSLMTNRKDGTKSRHVMESTRHNPRKSVKRTSRVQKVKRAH